MIKNTTDEPQSGEHQSAEFRRRVFYVHGFDPRPARLYHARYVTEAGVYDQRFGTEMTVGPMQPLGPLATRWLVRHQGLDGRVTETEHDFAQWRDLVSTRMKRGLVVALRDAVTSFVSLAREGYFGRIWRADASFLWTCVVYPFAAILFYVLTAVGAGFLIEDLFRLLSVPGPMAVLAGVTVGGGVLWATHRYDRNRYSFYLSYFLAYLVEECAGRTPELDQRMRELGLLIASAAASDDYDEVLVVGHSAGAIRAVTCLAHALEGLPEGARISFLTLGQAMPATLYLRGAGDVRADLEQVARDPRIDWVDVSAPRDLLCFATLDVTRGPFLPGSRPEPGIKIVAAPFGQIYDAELLKSVRFDVFEQHFVYLYANSKPHPWDWFAVTAGPGRLAQRFAGERRPKKADRMACE